MTSLAFKRLKSVRFSSWRSNAVPIILSACRKDVKAKDLFFDYELLKGIPCHISVRYDRMKPLRLYKFKIG